MARFLRFEWNGQRDAPASAFVCDRKTSRQAQGSGFRFDVATSFAAAL